MKSVSMNMTKSLRGQSPPGRSGGNDVSVTMMKSAPGPMMLPGEGGVSCAPGSDHYPRSAADYATPMRRFGGGTS